MALDSWLKKGGGVIERRALNKGGSYKKNHYPVLILLYLKLKKL